MTRANSPRDLRVRVAKAVGQRLPQLRTIGITHDRGLHGGRPAKMIIGEEIQKLLHLRAGKSANTALAFRTLALLAADAVTALVRQHPRNLFDALDLRANEGNGDELRSAPDSWSGHQTY